MKRMILLCIELFFLAIGIVHAQGWEFIGPDSIEWRDVHQLDGSFREGTSPRIVAATSGGAIARFGRQWKLVLTLDQICSGTYCFDRAVYGVYFLPWNDSVAFWKVYTVLGKYPDLSISRIANTYAETLWSSHDISLTCCYPHRGSLAFSQRDSNVYTLITAFSSSSDGGQTWAQGDFHPDLYYDNYFLSTNLTIDSLLYYGSGFSLDIHLSTDRGTNWNYILRLPFEYSDAKLLANGNTLVLNTANTVVNSPPSTDCGIYQSTDQGTTWTQTLSGINVSAIVRDKFHPQRLCAATSNGIYKSYNEGASWYLYNNTLPTTNLRDIIMDPYSDTLYVATDMGLYKVFDKVITGIRVETDELPVNFSLKQNYPNPFNPSTRFDYALPHDATVSLKIFNVLGEEVATIVSERQSKGYKSVNFDASRLASGVYFYRLQAGNFISVKKMLLMK